MQALWWCRLCELLNVQWKSYRRTFLWLVIWCVVGGVLGIVTIVIGDVAVENINYQLIDGNILNATALGSSIGSFIWQRILSLVIPVLLVFGFALLSKFTAFIIFPLVLMHGYWLSVAIWWVFFYYSLPAILVIIFYTVWLLLVTAILLIGLIWALRWGCHCRTCCGKQKKWGSIIWGLCIITGIAVVLGLIEFLVFWAILGKIVYKAL